MKLRFALASFALLAAESGASAQLPPIKPTVPISSGPVIKAPPDLGQKRGSVFAGALARSGLAPLTVPPPPAYAKLTPIAPTTNGARILQVGGMTFVGASPERPDGLFIIEAAPAGTYAFPGLPNPVVMAINIPKGTLNAITFARSGATNSQPVSPEDGHFIYAFRTGNISAFGTEWVQLTIPQTSYFFGCEITKGT